ncbi:VWA domain-containing protein [Picrophilus oshimae]|nr:VWA domain-containing protein [Picrophilus oshimae]
MRLEYSHGKSTTKDVMTVFKVVLYPEKTVKASGFHYIIAIDVSNSMRKGKLDLAKEGAMNLIEKIPRDNIVSLIAFGDTAKVIVEGKEPTFALEAIPSLKVAGNTAMYTALLTATKLADKYNMPGRIILLTDGMPTDVSMNESYENLQVPEGFTIDCIGIGDNYRDDLLKLLADKGNSIFYHLENPEELPKVMESTVSSDISAKNVQVDFEAPEKIKILNYSGPPVKIGFMEGAVKIYGKTPMRKNFEGELLKVKLRYELGSMKFNDEKTVKITRASSNEDYLANLNGDLINEYRYFELLNAYEKDVSAGNLVEATRKMDKINEVAEQTRRMDLIESTRNLASQLEATRRIGETPEATRNLARETASEVTKKLRG